MAFQAKQAKPEVSTHSRPKAAAGAPHDYVRWALVSTHSRPKAAAPIDLEVLAEWLVSTHSRPKAAAKAKRTTLIR